MPRITSIIAIVVLGGTTLPCAYAHIDTGGHGLGSVLVHPFTAGGHIVVMLTVGLVAAWQQGARQWLLPAVFAGSLAFGACGDPAAVDPRLLAAGLALSVVAAGIALATAAPWKLSASLPIAGIAGFMHGQSHAVQFHNGGDIAPQLLAFGLLAITLPVIGLVAGINYGERLEHARRVGGTVIALAGMQMLFNLT